MVYRSYSLCGDGRADAPWEITVKRHEDGLISTYLCQSVAPGALLRSSLPQGSFTLPAELRPGMPIVLVAGGSGITPIMGILRALARLAPARRARVWLHYAYHSPSDAIYSRELAAIDPQGQWLTQRHYVSTHGARLHADQVVAGLGAEAQRVEWYICGPDGLKRALETETRRQGVSATQVHSEVFASPSSQAALPALTGSSRSRLRLAESGAVLATQTGETLLETLERHGYDPVFSCRAGACGTCRLRLLAGRVRNGDGAGLSPAARAEGYVLSCVAEPVGDVTLSCSPDLIAAPRGAANASRVGGKSAAGLRTRRATARRSLRLGLAAAAVSVFVTTWGLTSHTASTQAHSSTTPSNSTTSGAGGSSSGNSSSNNSTSSSGSSSIQTQPSQSLPSTSTGAS
jgi:ring-1,2-phenylacetyl-CoA epoxidase subunit PaaE